MKYPLEIEISDYCSLKCNYCPNKNFSDKGYMTFENFKLIVSYIRNNLDNILFLDLSGIGDIFLHPHIEKFLLYLSDNFSNKELNILIPTKGNSITDKQINILKKCFKKGLRFNLSIGFYSLRKKIHDNISGVKNFDKIMLNIKKLKSNNIPFSLEMLINKYSIKELNYFYKFGDNIGVNYKVHNYHNFGGSIKGTGFTKFNSIKYKLKCTFADDETYGSDFYCKFTFPFISKDGYLFLCSHGGKQEKFKFQKINVLFNKYKNYLKLLKYIKLNLNKNICSKCTYLNYNIK